MSLFQAMQNDTTTANGSPAVVRTGFTPEAKVLDFYYHAAASRADQARVLDLFKDAYGADQILAMKALFYLRDIRGGQGERQSFRTCMEWLAKEHPDTFMRVAGYIPEYGRWDDLIPFMRSRTVGDFVLGIIEAQIDNDLNTDHPSLLAKWLPSEFASARQTRRDARFLAARLEMSVRRYRKLVGRLREKIDIVERAMSTGKWDTIKFQRVPGRAMKLYFKSFRKRLGDKFEAYLKEVEKGKQTIKGADTLYPHEIARAILRDGESDPVYEAIWKTYEKFFTSGMRAVVMADVSGSMQNSTYDTKKRRKAGEKPDYIPISVSVSLALLFAEMTAKIDPANPFSGHYMTFTDRPRLVKPQGKTLYDKLRFIFGHDVGYNTDIMAAMRMIVDTAKQYRLRQEDLPNQIIIISDMQFDHPNIRNSDKLTFITIEKMFNNAGYAMPQIVFWNVNDFPNAPVLGDQRGATLVSGYSPGNFKFITGNQYEEPETPIETMLRILRNERYTAIGTALHYEIWGRA